MASRQGQVDRSDRHVPRLKADAFDRAVNEIAAVAARVVRVLSSRSQHNNRQRDIENITVRRLGSARTDTGPGHAPIVPPQHILYFNHIPWPCFRPCEGKCPVR